LEANVISSLTALSVVVAAVIGSTATIGVLAYFLHRIRQIEAKGTGESDSHHLDGAVKAMEEELLTIQQEFSALAERLDFTEKLLTSSDDAGESADSA
jgi:putative effector of murein hydrolase